MILETKFNQGDKVFYKGGTSGTRPCFGVIRRIIWNGLEWKFDMGDYARTYRNNYDTELYMISENDIITFFEAKKMALAEAEIYDSEVRQYIKLNQWEEFQKQKYEKQKNETPPFDGVEIAC